MDTRSLRELVRHRGPFASVYLDFSHDTEDAATQLELRRRAVREQLAGQGVDEDTAAALDAAIERHEPAVGRAGLALVGAGGEVLLDEVLHRPPPQPLVRHSDLPYLLPLAELAEPAVPHVVVVIDKVGADFRAVDRTGAVVMDEPVEGDEHPVHKVRGGGWSHRRMQNAVEETVKHNVQLVAEETARLAERVGARVVIVAGEVQTRSALLAELPVAARELAVEIEAGRRAEGTDEDALDREVARVLDEAQRADQEAVLETYRAESGRDGGRAAQGLSATAAALREGNAEVLLVNPGRVERQTVWCSPEEPAQVGAGRGELREFGIADAAEYRADEVLPVAAVAVGAGLQVDGGLDLADGVGVLLRH